MDERTGASSIENRIHYDAATLRHNIVFHLRKIVVDTVKGEVYAAQWFNSWDPVRIQSQIIIDSVNIDITHEIATHENTRQKKQK